MCTLCGNKISSCVGAQGFLVSRVYNQPIYYSPLNLENGFCASRDKDLMNILNFIGIFVNSIATMISGIVTVYKLNTLHYYSTATYFWQSVYRLAAILLHF